MDISDNITIVSNDMYNFDLLLNDNKENEDNKKSEISLKTENKTSKLNTIIDLFIINIQIL